MKTVTSAQAAINAVEAGAAGIYEDTYMDQASPSYIILETADELARFESLVDAVREAPSGTPAVSIALEALEELVGQPCETSHLFRLYRDGQWFQTPESILEEEEMRYFEEEDYHWFMDAREGFWEMEDPTPIVPDEPWRHKVVKLATEIAAREGRAPEEVDFNTAMLQLGDEIPPEELRLLQEDLRAVEEGRSW